MNFMLNFLSKSTQNQIIAVIVILWLIFWVFDTFSSNKMQKQVNYALLSGQNIELTQLLPSAQIICVVPPKRSIHGNAQIDHYLFYRQLKRLNRKIDPIWRMFIDEWHLVGIAEHKYEVYRMGDMTMPAYTTSAQCLSIKEHPKITIAPIEAGSKNFYVVQSEN